MIDVKSKRCKYENCTKQPSYNLPTEKTPLYCKEHKSDDMIIVKNIQLYYNDDYEIYQPIKEENITNIVAL